MSWNTAKKRFQRDLDKLPPVLRNQWAERMNKHYALPGMEAPAPPDPKAGRKSGLDVGITAGDLAYITEGEKKGTITTVFQYIPTIDLVVLANVTHKALLPKPYLMNKDMSHYADMPKYVPRSQVRLVGKEKDENGKIGYLVAENIAFGEKYYDDRYKKWLPRRFVKHHEEIEIPWPSPPLELEEGDLLTNEGVAHERTYEFQLMARTPLPEGVVDELRNKYSKHKQRKFSALQIARLQTPTMPLSKEQKLYLAKQQKRDEANAQAAKPTQLLEEIQQLIGDKMAKHINLIDNKYMLAHLDALLKQKVPDQH